MKCLDIQKNKLIILNKKYELLKEKKYENEEVEFYISPPWIDVHNHSNPNHLEINGKPDDFGIYQGVGYIFDAGSTGVDNLNLWDNVTSNTKIFLLLNFSKKGIIMNGELKNMNFFTKQKEIQNIIDKYPIKGFKIRLSPTTTNFPEKALKKSMNISKKFNLPLMIHIGNKPPSIKYILQNVKKQVIITHCFNGKDNNLLNSNDLIDILKQKIKKGLKLDVGHGSESFSFEIAKKAFLKKIKPFSISTDMYNKNFNGPVLSLANVMSKFLHIGYSVKTILNCVTNNPSSFFNIKKYPKSFKDGFTLFKIQDSKIFAFDATKGKKPKKIILKKIFVPKIIKHNNKIFKIKEETLYGQSL